MLATSVGGVALDCCIYNASGPKSGHVTDLTAVGRSRAGAVLSKSATLLKQTGNPLPRLKRLPLGGQCDGSVNSEGLPNAGIDYYISSPVLDAIHGTRTPYIVSLSGLSVGDNVEMLCRVAAAAEAHPGRISAVELNLACPNIVGKPTVALDFEQMEEVTLSANPLFISANSFVHLGERMHLGECWRTPRISRRCSTRSSLTRASPPRASPSASSSRLTSMGRTTTRRPL